MKKTLYALILTFALPCTAFAQPASEQSIRELLKITKTAQLIDQSYTQLEPIMNSIFEQTVQNKGSNSDLSTKKAYENFNKKYAQLITQELSWKKLEPDFIKLYTEVYTQEEINGMIDFYKTPVGQSTIEKMPLVADKSMQLMQTHLTQLIPKLSKLAEESKQEVSK